jgi:hypothetical protein
LEGSNMKQRGRKSTEALQIAAPIIPAHAAAEPGSFLTPEERGVWDAIVASKAPDWFTADTVPLLEGLCRAVAMTRWLAVHIAEAQATDPVDFTKLNAMLKMQDREQRGASSLATKLRLTLQSRYQPSTAGTKQDGFAASIDPATGQRRKKPWEA